MSIWYRTGTVAVTNGAAAVVGTTTLWTTQASVGDIFIGPDLVSYEITAITDDTHMTIRQLGGTAAYAGSTASAQAYAIIRNFTSTLPAQLASQLAAMMTAWHVTTDDWANWLGGTGTVTVHDAAGVAYTVATPAALSANYNGRLSKSVAGGADVTLTATEASNLFIELTGALSANINVIVPASARIFYIANLTSGAYTVKIKTASGTGVFVPQGGRATLECDGTNVLNPGIATSGANSDITSLSALLSLTVAGAGNMPGYKNLVINGSCRIAQRGNVTLSNGGSATYGGADRIWGTYSATAGTATLHQSTQITNAKSLKSQLIDLSGMNTSSVSNHAVAVETYLEAKSVEHLNGKTVSYAFRLGSSLPAGSTVNIALCVPTGGVADVWGGAYGTVLTGSDTSFVAVTDGMLVSNSITLGATDASKGLAIRCYVKFPTNASWSGWAGVSDLYLGEGSAVPAFEMPPVELERTQCQRYYRASSATQYIPLSYGTVYRLSVPLGMRAAPTITAGGYMGGGTQVPYEFVTADAFQTGANGPTSSPYITSWTANAEL